MQKRNLLLTMASATAAVAANGAATPNLLVIHTDEHNFRTLSCYQNQLPHNEAFVWGDGVNSTTPNIDRIANEGAICNSYYCSSPVSTPSRASLVTGLYPYVTGAPKNGDRIKRDIPTFGTILRDKGYSTSYVGKWHLEGEVDAEGKDTKYDYVTEYDGGFTDNKYMTYGGHSPFLLLDDNGNPIPRKGVSQAVVAKMDKSKYIHQTDFFTNKTLDIIERDKNKPFCIMLSIPDPHTPDYALPEYFDIYKDMKPQMPMTMKPEYASKRPSWATAKRNEVDDKITGKELLHYFGMVKHIDDSVGRLLKKLEDEGILDNTIVVFTSDHGDMFYEHKRRNKGVPYEASARIPFVIRYPKAIPAGKVVNESTLNVDFAPTILSLMGVKTDAKFDGSDTSENFTSKAKVVDRGRIIYFSCTGGWWICATDGRYKLVLDKTEKPYLFDMDKDPFETVNVYNTKGYEKVSKEMLDELLRQAKEFKEPGLRNAKPYVM